MLRIIPSVNAAAAKNYYTQGLSREDYYSQGQEIIGQWYGKAAERLGLKGQVRQAEFEALCDNQHPQTGKNLTPRTKANRRVGYDLNFHCPKSVSLVYSQTSDLQILNAFQEAVRETMYDVETGMQTRVRQRGQNLDRSTGNMAWAEFTHFTARPAGHKTLPDPHLHAHCFVFNATFDTEEKKWKAGQFGTIKQDAPFYEAAFHARLAGKLQDLGYGIERSAKGWEIAGIQKATLEKFSKRTAEIERVAKDKGITDAKQKDALGAKTRKAKVLGVSQEKLRQAWDQQLTDTERESLSSAKGIITPQQYISPAQAVEYALKQSFERKSVVTERQLMTAALHYGVGSVRVEDVRAEISRNDVLSRQKDGQTYVTTRNVLREEKSMIDYVRSGRGTCRPFLKEEYQFKREFLNEGQKRAVLHVLTSQDRVTGIRGRAGTGKTTLTKEAIDGLQEAGKGVFCFAPSAEASRGVLRSEGLQNADTVQRLLVDENLQSQVRNQVIWIDEAGMLGVNTLNQVFDVAKKQNARIILSGDIRQHGSVERGDALRILEQQAGLRSALVSEIKRQRGTYKDAVERLAEGDILGGLEKLERMGAVQEVPSETRHKQLAADYLKALDSGKTALVVSPTHKEGEKVTALIRDALKKQGAVGKEEQKIFQQKNLNWTEAERGDPANYKPGLMLQLTQNVEGMVTGVRAKGLKVKTQRLQHFKRGEKLEVQSIDPLQGELTVRRSDGRISRLSLEQASRFQVYETSSLPLAYGDLIRITQNGYSLDKHRLNNGAMYRIKGFTEDKNIVLENDWVLPATYGNLAHGYCTTSHAAQGKTVDRVFVAQGSESFPAASQEQFYVSVSRAREKVTIYTDNKTALKDSVSRSGARLSATELTQPESGTVERGKFAMLVNRLATYAQMAVGKTRDALIQKYGRASDYAQERLHQLQQEYQREREREYGFER